MFEWIKDLLGAKEKKAATPTAPVVASSAPEESSPVIGISGGDSNSASVRAMVAMLRGSGATPVVITNHEQRIAGLSPEQVQQKAAADLAAMSAVIVMGNDGDIDPAKYGQQAHPKTVIEKNPSRAAYEEALIKQALNDKVPLLGVCGGMQRLNVLNGGSLIQHVPDVVGHEFHNQGDMPGYIPVQFVSINKDTKLGNIAGSIKGIYTPGHSLPEGVVMENSFHHQAVDKVGSGLRVAAQSVEPPIEGQKSRSVVQAIEADPAGPYANQFVMGVQWHPEFGASALAPKLVGAVVGEAKQFAKTHNKPAISEMDVQAMDVDGLAPGAKGGMVDYVLGRRAAASEQQALPSAGAAR